MARHANARQTLEPQSLRGLVSGCARGVSAALNKGVEEREEIQGVEHAVVIEVRPIIARGEVVEEQEEIVGVDLSVAG